MRALKWYLAFIGLLDAMAPGLLAAVHLVQARDYYFTPTNLTIAVGDSVVWTNTTGMTHDATSAQGIWASANIQPHATYSRVFTNLGSFPYICQQHIFSHPEMTGQVVVAETSLPSFVSLTSPTNGARFLAPAAFSVEAAITNGVTVTNVQFFRNGALAAEFLLAPYALFESDLEGGNYTYLARAESDTGLASTSAPVTIQVLVRSILAEPVCGSSSFQFIVPAIAGQTYVAEFSTNLLNWLPFATNTNAAATLKFTDSGATNSARFYRVRQDL